MSKTITTVTVKNISEDDQRLSVTAGEPKVTVEAGAEFETSVENAKNLQRMYPKIFRIVRTFVEPVQGEAPSKGEITAAKVEVLQDVYTAVATSILPATLKIVADDEVAQGIINDFNAILADANDDEHPIFALTTEQELVVTAEDIKNNAGNLPEKVKVGDTVMIPVDAYERPAVEEVVEDTDKADLVTENETLKARVEELELEKATTPEPDKVENKNGAQNVQKPPSKNGEKK